MRVLLLAVLLAFLGVATAAAAATPANGIAGTWLTNDGTSKVRITESGGVYDGHVVWLKDPTFPADDAGGMAGKPKVDRQNPDPALRSRPVMGLAVLTGLRPAGANAWDGGTIYTPATGKSYPCKATVAADGTLKLTVGGGVFGRTIAWTRVSP